MKSKPTKMQRALILKFKKFYAVAWKVFKSSAWSQTTIFCLNSIFQFPRKTSRIDFLVFLITMKHNTTMELLMPAMQAIGQRNTKSTTRKSLVAEEFATLSIFLHRNWFSNSMKRRVILITVNRFRRLLIIWLRQTWVSIENVQFWARNVRRDKGKTLSLLSRRTSFIFRSNSSRKRLAFDFPRSIWNYLKRFTELLC